MSNDYLIIIPEITKGMKSIGSKALLPLNTKNTILDYQIKSIKLMNRQSKIYLSTGFQNNKVKKVSDKYKNINSIYEANYENCNESKHIINYIKKNIDNLNNLFIIKNGVLFKNRCFGSNRKKNKSKIFFLDKDKDNFNIGCHDENSKYLFYELQHKWCECVFLVKSDLQKIFEMNQQKPINNYFLFEIINFLQETSEMEHHTVSYRNIMKVNSANDLKKAKRFVQCK